MFFYFFFFQAEDGIRDIGVTGVQTCALPICPRQALARGPPAVAVHDDRDVRRHARRRAIGAREGTGRQVLVAAHDPLRLPWMMIGPCAGTRAGGPSGLARGRADRFWSPLMIRSGSLPARSDLHDFLLLSGENLIDLLDGLVGCLLDLVALALLVVLADGVILFELLEE